MKKKSGSLPENPEKKRNFLHGALILTAGMAAVKLIGALFKIPLKYAIGEYGMGLFNAAYHFYGPVFSLATAGFPIAVSRMVSENASLGRWRDVHRVKGVAMPLFLLFGLIGMILLSAAAPLYCRYGVNNMNALYPILALAPAIVFACAGSVYRGYYAGLGDMVPTAVSEVAEAAIKLGLGLFAAYGAVSLGTEEYAASGTVFGQVPGSPDEASFLILSFAAAGAILGVTLGSAFSLLYLLVMHRLGGDKIPAWAAGRAPEPQSFKRTAKSLLRITLPVALGSIAMNAAGLIDATFLQSRVGEAMALDPQGVMGAYPGMIPPMYLANPDAVPTFLYGCYSLALTVYLLVPSVTQALGVSALPAVTEAWAKGDKKELGERVASVLRVTAFFCFPAGLGLSALSGPVSRLLFGNGQATPITAASLSLLGLAAVFTAMSTPLSNLLQAVGRADMPVKLLTAAMVLKLGINWALCGVPEFNVQGAAIGTLLCYLFLTISQLLSLKRAAGISLSLRELFFAPCCCGVLCGGSAWACHRVFELFLPELPLGELFPTGFSILLGALIYGLGLLLLGGIRKKELFLLPKGQKIIKMLEKREWI